MFREHSAMFGCRPVFATHLPPSPAPFEVFFLSDPVRQHDHGHLNGCFLAGQSLLHCGSGMVDTNLQNVTVGACNQVRHISSEDTMILKE